MDLLPGHVVKEITSDSSPSAPPFPSAFCFVSAKTRTRYFVSMARSLKDMRVSCVDVLTQSCLLQTSPVYCNSSPFICAGGSKVISAVVYLTAAAFTLRGTLGAKMKKKEMQKFEKITTTYSCSVHISYW